MRRSDLSGLRNSTGGPEKGFGKQAFRFLSFVDQHRQKVPGLRRRCDLGFLAGGLDFSVPERFFFGFFGTQFRHFCNQKVGPAGTKKGSQNGPPNWACQKEILMWEGEFGGPFWLLFLGVSDPSHAARRGGQATSFFLQLCPAAGRSTGSE